MVSDIEKAFLKAIKEHKRGTTERLATHAAYADWLEEEGRKPEAARQRAAAGVSQLRFYATVKGHRVTKWYQTKAACLAGIRGKFERLKRVEEANWGGREEWKSQRIVDELKHHFSGLPRTLVRREYVEIVTEEIRPVEVERERLA